MIEVEASENRRTAYLEISPEPSPDEIAAIVAAVQSLLAARHAPDDRPLPSLWQEAGRLQALRGSPGPLRGGWLRASRLGR